MYIYSLYLNCLLRFPAAPPSGENWQLKVDKSIMFVQHIRQGILSASSMSQADTSDLLNKIMQVGLLLLLLLVVVVVVVLNPQLGFLVYPLIKHRNNVKCSKLKWNHKPY